MTATSKCTRRSAGRREKSEVRQDEAKGEAKGRQRKELGKAAKRERILEG